MSRMKSMVLIVGLTVGLIGHTSALGQARLPKTKPTTPATPAPTTPDPGAPAAPSNSTPTTTPAPAGKAPAQKSVAKEPKVGKFLVQEGGRDWNLVVGLGIYSDSSRDSKIIRDPSGRTARTPKITPFGFETLGVVFPFIKSSASSVNEEPVKGATGVNGKGFRGDLKFDDKVVSSSVQLLKGYSNGTMLAKWDAGERGKTTTIRQVQLDITLPMRAFSTKFAEAEAMKIGWPSQLPAVAQSALEPQLFVEDGVDEAGVVKKYDDAPLDKAMGLWKGEWGVSDLKNVPPAMLAKMIAGKVWGVVQPSGEGISARRTGEFAGFVLQPPSITLTSGKGSEHDMTVLLAALYRKAGIPTRTVIGYDLADEDRSRRERSSKLRSWVEFYLYDEATETANWIPVDIARLRKVSSRPQAIEREWKYFGTNPELDFVLPFAFHFHPPTDVVSYGSPGFWGWFVSPEAPKSAEQSIRFAGTRASVRGGEEKKDDKKKDKNY